MMALYTYLAVYLLCVTGGVRSASVQTRSKLLSEPSSTNHTNTSTNVTRSSIIFSSLSLRHMYNSQAAAECPQGEYLQTGTGACVPCSVCPSGFGVQRRCGLWSDTQCTRCVAGQEYLREYFGVPKCIRCTSCENRAILRQCSATQDSICSENCNPGYFPDDFTAECIECSYCYPEVPGYGVLEPMCQTPDQPKDKRCLPSLPPRQLRQLRTTDKPPVESGSTLNKITLIEERLETLENKVTDEITQVRQELQALKGSMVSEELD